MTIEVDLHLHTQASDGTLTPSELVDLCAARGLKVIAISDHDSTEGLNEAFASAKAHPDLHVIPAIELSADVPGSEIHILGYFIDTSDADFQDTLRRFREGTLRPRGAPWSNDSILWDTTSSGAESSRSRATPQ